MNDRATDGVHTSQWGAAGVVLVHGGTPGGGADAFAAQRPLAERWHMLLPDRPGHGKTPARGREDFERDAALLSPLLGPSGAHLVGHSYGGVVAIYIAAQHPDLVRSLTLIEPPAFWLAPHDKATVAMSEANRALTNDPPSDPRETLERFFALVGMEPLPPALAQMNPLPPPLVRAAEIVLTLRGPWEGTVRMTDLVAGGYPIQVLTSGRIAGFEGIAQAMVEGAGAAHVVVPGTHHAVQDAAEAVNPLLEQFWLTAETPQPAGSLGH